MNYLAALAVKFYAGGYGAFNKIIICIRAKL